VGTPPGGGGRWTVGFRFQTASKGGAKVDLSKRVVPVHVKGKKIKIVETER